MRALARAASLLRHAAVSAPTTGALHHPPLGVGSCLAKNLPGFFFNGYSTLLAPQSEVLIPPELLSSRTVWTPDRELGQYEDLVARVTNLHNEDKGFMVLDGDVFDVPIRKDIVHWVVRWQLAKRQQGTHSTKTISEVSGTGRKCYKQKGTGRARHGTLCGPNSVVVQPCMDLNHEAMQSSCRRKYGGWGLRLPCLLVLQRGSSWSLRTWKSLATRQKTLCNTLARWMIQRRFCWWMEATLIRS